jgi:dTMP kinase
MFVTFEGIEGSGKSTVLARVAEALSGRGFGVTVTREPGGSRLGQQLRGILLDMASRDLTGQSELFLYLADRAQHVQEVVKPALDAGRIVLSDRFADSTVVYQGYGRGLDPRLLHSFNEIAVAGCWPELTLLFDLPAEVGLKRALTRNMRSGTCATEGRFEAESLQFHTRVREGYLTWAALHQERYRVVDASQPLDAVVAAAQAILDQELAKRGKTPGAAGRPVQ